MIEEIVARKGIWTCGRTNLYYKLMTTESPRLPDAYTDCRLCPRRCGARRNRTGGGPDRPGGGFCGETGELRIAAASIHRGEEPPITGLGGSGTIFITGCTLGCLFCQNWQISQGGMGSRVGMDEFSRICLALQEKGVENINIVTGSHGTPGIVDGLRLARSLGLKIPVLWNSSAYESMQALSLLEDTVDIYLPDLKTLDRDLAGRFFRAPDYPQHAEAAILRMLELRGELRWESRPVPASTPATTPVSEPAPASVPEPAGGTIPVLVSGLIIRHLVLPDHLGSTGKVLRWFAEHGQGRALLSLMTQYTPVDRLVNRTANRDGEESPERAGARPRERAGAGPRELPPGPSIPQKQVGPRDYDRIIRWLEEFGIEEGFCQELVPGSEWLPDFRRANPFSSELSTPVWHWKTGFV